MWESQEVGEGILDAHHSSLPALLFYDFIFSSFSSLYFCHYEIRSLSGNNESLFVPTLYSNP